MSLGGTGFGFDFLIDPFRFGGQPGSASTTPYPIVAEEEVDAVPGGAFDIELVQALEELSAGTVALSGTIRDILQVINPELEAIDGAVTGFDGTLKAILKVINPDMESIDGAVTGFDGTIKRILIVINTDEAELDSIRAGQPIATGGTLT